MAVNGARGRKEFEILARARMEDLRRGIEDLTKKRDAINQSIADYQDELNRLEGTYPDNGAARGRGRRHTGQETAEVVLEILKGEGKPLHYRQIHLRLVARGVEPPSSDDPATAFLARYFNDPRLVRTAPGTYAVDPSISEGMTIPVGPTPQSHSKPASYRLLGEDHAAGSWIGAYRSLCEELYRLDEGKFRSSVIDLKSSKGNRYFSFKKGEYRQDCEILGSGIFVAGGLNNKSIRARCREIVRHMGMDPDTDFSIEF